MGADSARQRGREENVKQSKIGEGSIGIMQCKCVREGDANI